MLLEKEPPKYCIPHQPNVACCSCVLYSSHAWKPGRTCVLFGTRTSVVGRCINGRNGVWADTRSEQQFEEAQEIRRLQFQLGHKVRPEEQRATGGPIAENMRDPASDPQQSDQVCISLEDGTMITPLKPGQVIVII